MTKYILRFDDLSRYSDLERWREVFRLCEFYNVKPVVGVIPEVNDKNLYNGLSNSEPRFWNFIDEFKSIIDVAIHGLQHENLSLLTYSGQYGVLAKSLKCFMKRNIVPDILIPPNHMFDSETIKAMKMLGISYISDGIGLFPWKHINQDVIQVPQVFWKPRTMPFGVYTFCFHPETMTKDDIEKLGGFLRENSNDFISIRDADLTPLEVLNIPFKLVYKYLFKRRFGKPIPF